MQTINNKKEEEEDLQISLSVFMCASVFSKCGRQEI